MFSSRTGTNITRVLLAAYLAVFLFAAQAVAQAPPQNPPATFDLDKDRQTLVSLDGPWRFHPGDDPSWAKPDYDDTTWSLFYPLKPWPGQRFSGTAWFRAKVRVPANAGPLALYLFYIDDSHQIFADGQLITSAGGMPPHPRSYGISPSTLAVPVHHPGDQAYTLTLAIRVWLDPGWALFHPGGIAPGSRIGAAQLVQDAETAQITRWAWDSVSRILLSLLEGLAAFTALALFGFRRKEPEYLWFAIFLFASVASRCLWVYFRFHTLGNPEFQGTYGLLITIGRCAEMAFYYRLLAGRRSWLFWGAIASNSALIVVSLLGYFEVIYGGTLASLVVVLSLPLTAWILALLIRRVVQGFPDARLLIAPVCLSKIASLVSTGLWTVDSFGWFSGAWHPGNLVLIWPFDISLQDIGDTLFLVGMLAILVHRFTRTRLREESYEREREAARTVQQVLIPEQIPCTPGFQIQSVYQPFGEVGGDFFQVLPLPGKSVLIAIGDVSGKGLPAAMTVSLLVGTLRTLAHYTQSPGEILAAMNRRMLARTNGGFTTCLVLHAGRDGKLTVANAGHIAPYLNGVELAIDNGLPLGLAAESTYPESESKLPPEAQLVLLTDGVIEARRKTGELFGFERTAAVAIQSAESIAHAALTFGQDDDITVLTVARIAS
jgi:Stage II sporulation protein E (SpoIIE)